MRTAAVLASLLAFAATSLAEDKVELKLGVTKGQKMTRTSTFGGSGKLTVETGAGEQEMDCTMNEEEVLAEEVLEAENGSATKLKRRYSKKTSLFQLPAAGIDENKSSSLVGKIVTVERKDGKAVATCDGAEEKEIKKEHFEDKLDRALLPGKPVGVGDEWEADPEKLKEWFDDGDGEVEEAAMKCRLAAVEEKFGQKCAKIEADIKVKGTGANEDTGEKQTTTITAKGAIWFGLEAGRALGIEMSGKLKVKGKTPQGAAMRISIDLKMTGEGKLGEADFEAPADEGGGKEEEEAEEEGSGK